MLLSAAGLPRMLITCRIMQIIPTMTLILPFFIENLSFYVVGEDGACRQAKAPAVGQRTSDITVPFPTRFVKTQNRKREKRGSEVVSGLSMEKLLRSLFYLQVLLLF